MKKISNPNTTQVPNVIFDYWMSRLLPAEFKILLCICRKTFGWHKDKDRISLRQIEKMTGLARSGIIKSIDHLLELELVVKIKFKDEFDGSDGPNQYEINVFIPEEEESENIWGSTLSIPPLVNTENPPLVHRVDPQKKDITKERPTKEKSSSSSSSFANGKKPNEIDDDDGSKKIIFSSGVKKETSKSIGLTKTNGTKYIISETEIFRHFIKLPQYSTEVVQEAIERLKITGGVINNALKYLESICQTILSEQITTKKSFQETKTQSKSQNVLAPRVEKETVNLGEYYEKITGKKLK